MPHFRPNAELPTATMAVAVNNNIVLPIGGLSILMALKGKSVDCGINDSGEEGGGRVFERFSE